MSSKRERRLKKEEKIENDSNTQELEKEETAAEEKTIEVEPEAPKINLEEELQEMKNKYLRLYADFENYKKRVQKDKEELIKYGNESLLYDLLPVIDNLEMAVKHCSEDMTSASGGGLVQGVEITLKEFLRVLERFELIQIAALDKMFDPMLHHAMTQIERDDVVENTIVEEYRKGYMLRDKVLRPSLVAVSKKSDASKQSAVVSNEKENLEIKGIEEVG